MQAIITKVLPCTNTKPTRIKAMCAADSLTVSIHSLKGDGYYEQHKEVAQMLVDKLGWSAYGLLSGGDLPVQTGYHSCFVFPEKKQY